MGGLVFKQGSYSDADKTVSVSVPRRQIADVTAILGMPCILYTTTKAASSLRGRYVAAGIVISATPDDREAVTCEIGGIDPFPFPRVANLSSAAYESGMRGMNAKSLQHHIIRPLDDEELIAIIEKGKQPYPFQAQQGLDEPQTPFLHRERERRAASQILRMARLRITVTRAYQGGCLFTGPVGRSNADRLEGDVSHWRRVADGGPDVIGNTAFVTRSLHWYIEEGELSLSDNYAIIASPSAGRLIAALNPSGRLYLPRRSEDRPAVQFLRYHCQHRLRDDLR